MTLRFNDISHYQGTSFPIDGPIIAKATEGSNFTDSAYASNRKRTLAAGFLFCAYHFPLYAASASMAAQAAHAKNVIGTDTPVMMDVEKDVNGHWISRDDCLHQIDLMQAAGMKVVLAYIPKWFWSGCWGSASLKPFADRGLGLISSQYVGTYSDSGPGWDAYGGVKPIIWQYTDGLGQYAGGGMHHADTNAFKGTIAELAAVFAGLPAPTTGDDMLLTDKLSNGQTVDQVLTTILGRSANLGPWEKDALDGLAAAVAALDAKVAGISAGGVDMDALSTAVADKLATRLQS